MKTTKVGIYIRKKVLRLSFKKKSKKIRQKESTMKKEKKNAFEHTIDTVLRAYFFLL